AAPPAPAARAAPPPPARQAAVAPDAAPAPAAGPTAPAGLAEVAQQAVQAVLGPPSAHAEDEPAEAPTPPTQAPTQDEAAAGPAGAAVRKEPATLAELLEMIRRPVERELARHGGDVDAATAALVKKAIPDAMALLAASRVGARYEHTDHPPLPDILKKASKASADQVWEARPKWKNSALIKGADSELTVSALDMNGAYLSALKSHLPIGQLKHNTTGEWDPKQAGLYLATPPAWEHPDLPNPIGNRDEPGPLWLTSSTMRMLQRLAGPKLGLCEAPIIHEAWTAYSTENILESFRQALGTARDTAIAENDFVTLEYVKAMYSKFVSTIGLSTANHKIKRPDWMHIIRAQAFANLWWKGKKAHDAGLTIVQMIGTDELHLVGDWRTVFPEGRKVTEVKLKDTYTIGGGK
ncbi:Clp protease/crotonase-like domain-containing protein, partial [Kitasatospora indigofera]|uniref:transcriptional regulator n=1 Tax=Kitasatospora indigofera TaxID=67307 RepID=UPI0036CDB6FF